MRKHFRNVSRPTVLTALVLFVSLAFPLYSYAGNTTDNPGQPTWWNKHQYLAHNGTLSCAFDNSISYRSNNVSFYDTRNDTTGFRYMTDTYLAHSTDGGVSWSSPDVRVTTVSSNEHDCDGVYPCAGIDYGNQQGDYEGLVSYGGISHPIWTDSRNNLAPCPGCQVGLFMEEVFTAQVEPNQ